jgi:cytochrome c556
MKYLLISGGSLLLALLLSVNSGASGDGQDGVNQHRQVQVQPGQYSIHDDQLRETMFQLNALVSYAEQPTAPLDEQSKEFLQNLIDTVGVVASSAESLKQATQTEGLDEEQWTKFSDLADQLYSEAIDIELNARKVKVEEMNRAFLNLNQTCIACHKLFRSL